MDAEQFTFGMSCILASIRRCWASLRLCFCRAVTSRPAAGTAYPGHQN
jgi:hypothetical protein